MSTAANATCIARSRTACGCCTRAGPATLCGWRASTWSSTSRSCGPTWCPTLPTRRAATLPREQPLGELALVVVQAADALLDRAGGHQPVHRHRPLLPDAVRAAHRLVFGGRVPPRVGNHHVVGRGQVQAVAAGL